MSNRLRPHGKQAARKTVDKAGTNARIANEALRLDGRVDSSLSEAKAYTDSAMQRIAEKGPNDRPDSYPATPYHMPVSSSGGYPVSGRIECFGGPASAQHQMLRPAPEAPPYVRRAVDSATWGSFVRLAWTNYVDDALTNYYTSTQSDSRYYTKSETYSTSQVDAKIAPRVSRITPSLANGWSTHSGYRSVSYFQDHGGTVVFRGAISGGTITDGTVMFRLNSAVWPPFEVIMKLASVGDARAHVDTGGYVTCRGMASSFAGFDGLNYSNGSG